MRSNDEIINLIDLKLRELGMTRLELANAVGYSESKMSRIMTGRTLFAINDADKFCSALNITIQELLGIEDENNKPISTENKDTLELLEEMHKNPNLKVLLHEGMELDPEDLEFVISMVEKMKK